MNATQTTPSPFQDIEAIILAGGRGSRLKMSDKSKVMLEIGGKPMLEYPVERLEELGLSKPIVVVGFARESIQSYFQDRVQYAVQEEAIGTADAVSCAVPLLQPTTKHVIVFYGDHSMFYTAEMIATFIQTHLESKADMTLVTTETDPTGFGRVIRDTNGEMLRIVEEKNATDEEKKIREINTGNGIYTKEFLLEYLPKITRNAISGEYYLTDIVELGKESGASIKPFKMKDHRIGIGVNTPDQLLAAKEAMEL